MIGYGTPELTAEAMVLRFPDRFSPEALSAAQSRLEEAGLRVGDGGNIVGHE